MDGFLDAAASFPTAIFSTLLAVALIYWLLAVLGVVDAEADSLEGTDGVDGLAGWLVAVGLAGVPLSLMASVLVLAAWTLSCLGAMWLLPLLPAGALRIAAGVVLAVASLSAAVPIASLLLRPLRRLFVTHTAVHNAALVGQTCKVLTGSVDEQAGRAEVLQRGAPLNIRVWARTPNTLARGANARIVAYDEATARYRIEGER